MLKILELTEGGIHNPNPISFIVGVFARWSHLKHHAETRTGSKLSMFVV